MKLIPPDKKCCQAEMKAGVFQLGGSPQWRRCTNVPDVIATEKRPGGNRKRGAMSLCSPCRAEFEKRMPVGYATFRKIRK